MRRGNLPDGGHNKRTWKGSKDLLTRRYDNVNPRRHRFVLTGRRRYVPLRLLGGVPLRRCWVFHLRPVWDVMEKYHWDVVATFIETSLGVLFETYLRRHWNLQSDVATTSPRRLVARSVFKSCSYFFTPKINFENVFFWAIASIFIRVKLFRVYPFQSNC